MIKYLIYRMYKQQSQVIKSPVTKSYFPPLENNTLLLAMNNNPSKIPWEIYYQETKNDLIYNLYKMNL